MERIKAIQNVLPVAINGFDCDNDGRVAPYESRKMVARLQAASTSGYPILLSMDAEAGHGIGTGLSSESETEADVYTILVDRPGIPGTVKRPCKA